MAALEQQATEKAEQKGKEPSKPKDNAQYNFTDPDSRIMKSADRAYIQAYNAQAAVDEQHQIVVAAEVTQQANDKGWLVPMVHQVVDRLELVPEQVSADAGYWGGARCGAARVVRHRGAGGAQEAEAQRLAQATDSGGTRPRRG